jgi:hypothetical protein
MDLRTMKDRAQKLMYKSVAAVEADLDQILINCQKFNTERNINLYLEPIAKQLCDTGRSTSLPAADYD